MIASAIGWWADAGVDMAVSETPRDWLSDPLPAPPRPQPVPPVSRADIPGAAEAPPQPQTIALPNDLATLHTLLATGTYAPGAAPPGRRVGPSGDPAAGLMIVADMPDAPDFEAGHLLSGETQRLFDAMLAAMGRSRDSIYLAPLSPARIPGGRIDGRQADALIALMRRHIALARPRAVMLLGDETCRALLGIERGPVRGGLRELNHDGGTVPAIAIMHPRYLRQYPSGKADAWADMRRLIGEYTS